MSSVIDSRIVEMQFDNKQFESAVSTSMGTLSKLKESLNFEKNGASVLQSLSDALGKIDLSGLSSALEGAGEKFSVLEQVAIGALRRIGEQGIDYLTGKIKELSVDQISAGWEKYGEMTTNVATIMAATGDSMETVSAQMEKLLYFTDETSYNFTDMANNIGKFTANGISLDKATSAMEGIATWAAKSGQNAGTASRVMYNLAQAIGMGALKLQDWKSVELANMGTKEFKEMAIQAGVASGTLKKVGDKIVTVGKKTAVTVSNFRETLAEGWLDSNTLMGTLNEYGKAAELISNIHDATGLYAADMMDLVDKQQKGKLSTAAMAEALGLNASEIDENKDLIEDLSKSIEKLASDEYKFSLEAYKAGQEARTWADAVDATKDAVSSGWMKTFQMIFGQYEESKGFWTDIAESFYNIFAEGAQARNLLLQDWGDSKWGSLTNKIAGAGASVSEFEAAVSKHLKAARVPVDDLISEYGSLSSAIENGAVNSKKLATAAKSAINDVINGGKGSAVDAEGKLKEIQGIVNKVWSGALGNGSERRAAIEALGYDYDSIQKLVEKGSDAVLKIEDLTDEQLKALGLTEAQIKELQKLSSEVDFSDLSGLGGRATFLQGILDVLSGVEDHLALIKDMWKDVFGEVTADSLRKVTDRFAEFASNLALYKENADGIMVLNQRGEDLAAVLWRIFDAGKQVLTFFKNIGRLIKQFATAMAPAASAARELGLALLDLFSSVMGRLNTFLGKLDFSEKFNKVSEVVTAGIEWITQKVDELRTKFEQTNFSEKLEKLGKKADEAKTKVSDFFGKFKTGLKDGVDFHSILEKISNALQKVKEFFQPVIDKLKEFWTALKGKFDFSNITSVGDAIHRVFAGIGDIVGGAWKGLLEAVDRLDLSFGDLIKTFIGTKIAGKLLTNVLGGNSGSVKKSVADLINSVKGIVDNFGEKGLIGSLFGDMNFGSGKSGFDKFSENIKKIGAAMLMAAGGVLALGLALLIFNTAVQMDPDGMGMLAMAAAMTTLVAALLALSVAGPKVALAGAGMLVAAVAVAALAGALLLFNLAAKQDPEGRGMLAMASAMTTLTAVLLALSVAGLKVIPAAAGLLLAATALIVMAGALALFNLVAKQDPEGMGLLAMASSLTVLTAALLALSVAGPVVIVAAAALIIAGAALLIFAAALEAFILIAKQGEDAAVGLVVLAGVLMILAGVLAVLGYIGVEVLAGAAALALAAVAVVALAAGFAVAAVALGLLGIALTVLIAGIGTATGQAIGAIGSGIGEALQAIGDGIGGLFSGIGQGIGDGITAIGAGIATANSLIGVSVESLGTSIGTGFENVAKGIGSASSIIGDAFDKLSESVGTTVEKFGAKVGGAIEGVGESIAKAGESIRGVGDSIASVGTGIASFTENVKGLGLVDLVKIGSGLIEFAKGVKKLNGVDVKFDASNVTAFVSAIQAFVQTVPVINTVSIQLETRLKQLGLTMGNNLAQGLMATTGAVKSAGNAVGSSAYAGANSYVSAFYNVGANMAQGLANGLSSGSGAVNAAASSVARGAETAAKRTEEIKSPSRAFARIGAFMSLGMAKGIKDEGHSVTVAAEQMSKNAIDIAAHAAKAIAESIANQDDSLTITPILDLSNVEQGTAKLSDMLSGTKTAIGLSGEISNATLSAQNGINAPQLVTLDPNAMAMMGMGAGGETVVRVNFEGSLAQLASILQPAIKIETNRLGENLVNE